ncbi:hypothetical protein ACJU26_08730 [Acidithiobacillus sp. M4-SHS-6]|uniref:hypothetical protein n=1 Tax=Acidithiobacillus sp. M4-SHS-6 TaxID=3383024 RepID=UPI0039BDCE0D
MAGTTKSMNGNRIVRDPTGEVPMEERYTIGPGGRVVLLPAYKDFYIREFGKAGMPIQDYLKDERSFVLGLRELNQRRYELTFVGEDEHLKSLPKIKRDWILAGYAKDWGKMRHLGKIMQRRKTFVVVDEKTP